MQQDLNEMAIFAAVADQGGFTKAAQKLSMPKSSVSRHISRLEERLGERLLNRTTRSMTLTEAGKLYFRHCRRIVEEAESAEATLASLQVEPAGRLRITAPLAFGAHLLQGNLNEFLARHPKISMELLLENRIVDLVEEEVDLAIRVGPLQESSLVARKVGSTVQCLCASPAFLSKYGEPKTLDDLNAYDVIRHPNIPMVLENGLEVSTHSRFGVNDMGVVASMARENFGIGLVPLPLVFNEIRSGELRPILLDFPLEARDFFLVYPSRRQLASKVIAFVDYMVEEMQGLDYWNVSVLEYLAAIKKEGM